MPGRHLPASSSSIASRPSSRRRLVAGAALTLVAAVAAGGLAGCHRTPAVLKIGVAQPLSGNLQALGQDLLNGARMAVDEINEAGGVSIDGTPVRFEIVSADDQANAGRGAAVAQQLVDAGVIAAIADLNSGVSIAAAPVYAKAGVPQLAISTKPEYTRLGLPTTLRLVANDDLQSRALGTYAARLPGASHFAVVDDGTPYGKGLADSAAKVIETAGKPVDVRQTLDDKTTDFTALVGLMKQKQVDVFVTTLSDFQVSALIEQAAKAGLTNLTVMGGDTIKTDKLINGGPLPIRDVYATSSIVEAREFEGGKAFLEAFHKRFGGSPVYGAHYAYDAVYLVADALARNNDVDKDRLLKTLKSVDGNCPMTKTMRFGADGEQRYGAVAVYHAYKGQWEPIMRSDQW